MTTRQPFAIALVMAAAALACGPKADTANPDDITTACTEEAKVCEDGSAVGREGPECEFAACPGEEGPEEVAADAGDEPEEAAADGGGEPSEEAE